jgi:hypothetical protein
MMIDCHAKRINELREIDRQDRYAQPLIAVLAVVLFLIIANAVLEVYAAKRHADQIQAASAFAQCLNGYKIQMENIQVGCKLQKIDLVKGMQ